MKKMTHSIHINAPVALVWDTMLNADTYPQWTKSFNPTSRYEGSWEQGATIRFIGVDPKDGKIGGMLARIKENRLHAYLSIEHYGIIENGKEDTTSDAVKAWAPAYENYTFTEKDGGTELQVEMDIEEKYEEMFQEMWPKALNELKRIAEEKV